jgi:hypothetical protein
MKLDAEGCRKLKMHSDFSLFMTELGIAFCLPLRVLGPTQTKSLLAIGGDLGDITIWGYFSSLSLLTSG